MEHVSLEELREMSMSVQEIMDRYRECPTEYEEIFRKDDYSGTNKETKIAFGKSYESSV